MNLHEINTLLQNTEGPCISISIPTDRINHKKNHEILKKAVQKAKLILKEKPIDEGTATQLIAELDRCTARLPETLSAGLGIFISPGITSILTFPFDVNTKIVVDEHFERRDLLYLQQYGQPYYVLNLSKKEVHLFEGSLSDLREVRDGNLPLLYEDEFEYQRASIANSSSSNLKSFEKDKNEISQIRLKTVFREADELLSDKLASDTKVLLAGTQKMVSLFNSLTSLKEKVAGKILGSYNENNFNKLRDSAWAGITRAKKREIEKQVEALHEKNAQIAEGLLQGWNAAIEGKGLTLLVEKDLHRRAYRNDQDSRLHLQPPMRPYTVIPDAVSDLIETVQSKHGKVILTENGQLKDFDHVALVLRY